MARCKPRNRPPRPARVRQLKLSRAFTLMESGPVVLVTTHDGHRIDRRKMMSSKIPYGA